MPVPYSPPNVGAYTWTPSHSHYDSCSAVEAQITSLRSDDLVVPKLPACGCEWSSYWVSNKQHYLSWWRRLVPPSCMRMWVMVQTGLSINRRWLMNNLSYPPQYPRSSTPLNPPPSLFLLFFPPFPPFVSFPSVLFPSFSVFPFSLLFFSFFPDPPLFFVLPFFLPYFPRDASHFRL